ncbi:ACP S-malonyltransferase [Lactobacillus sp. PV012]|uniref:ACP S-malonyltransferase n=1 Tax=Lactobacillus sp. PV012 TaxID=2594494 RepID=UPI00223FA49E|nr:ACP S-malonyltransferase [Lactobacillus sp. PV012]QNQ82026.1 ACP S-malonyltransferase [Lactobacillus sp. PV012]
MKTVLLFSGQGAQRPGMGLDFMADPLFKEIIEQASLASKKDILTIFKSENEELNKTVNVQPALVAFEAGIYQMLQRDWPDLQIQGMIGLSLGEYSAMFASGALDLENTISLVSDRARYMQEDANQVTSAMVAVLKPQTSKIETLLTELQQEGEKVFIANYNSPSQIVISGEKEAVKQASTLITEEKLATRLIELEVNGAFHTPLFTKASQKMHERLNKVSFSKNQIPVISNTTAVAFKDNWGLIMEKQLMKPTHFGACLQYLLEQEDIDTAIEIGPGKTLSLFAKQVNHKLKRYQLGKYKDYQKFIEEKDGIKG